MSAPLNTTEPLPTTTCSLQMTYWWQQQDKQTIDKPTKFTNDSPTDIWITMDRLKHTNRFLQSSQLLTSWLNWHRTNNVVSSSTNHDNDQRLQSVPWASTISNFSGQYTDILYHTHTHTHTHEKSVGHTKKANLFP